MSEKEWKFEISKSIFTLKYRNQNFIIPNGGKVFLNFYQRTDQALFFSWNVNIFFRPFWDDPICVQCRCIPSWFCPVGITNQVPDRHSPLYTCSCNLSSIRIFHHKHAEGVCKGKKSKRANIHREDISWSSMIRFKLFSTFMMLYLDHRF